MLSVNSSNILTILPQIKQDIDNSTIISFDTELSGISKNINLCDSMQQRYQKYKHLVNNYSILQLGISFFKPDHEKINKYISSTYLFHLKANLNTFENDEIDEIKLNLSSLQFLIANKFNLKTWGDDGSYFVGKFFQDKFTKECDHYIEKFASDLNMNIFDDIIGIYNWLRNYKLTKLFTSKKSNNNEHKLHYRPSKNYIFNYYYLFKTRKFLVENVELRKYLDENEYLWCDCINGRFVVMVVQVSTEAKSLVLINSTKKIRHVDELHQLMNEEKELLLKKLFSISTIFGWISESKATIVGHNLFIDLLFIYHNFFRPLPEQMTEFNSEINRIFPYVYDTKLIAQSERILECRYLCLFDCFLYLCGSLDSYRNYMPKIFIRLFYAIDSPEHDQYTETLEFNRNFHIEAHNAGVDAFITGFVFIHFGFILMEQPRQQNNAKQSRTILFDYRNFVLNPLKRYRNQLYQARNSNKPLRLGSNQINGRSLDMILLEFRNQKSVDLFLKLCDDFNNCVNARKRSHFEYYISTTSNDMLEFFMRNLYQCLLANNQPKDVIYIRTTDKNGIHIQKLRKFAWITFFSSATMTILCFTQFLLNRQ